MRVAVDWRSSSKDNYKKFCKKYPSIKLSFNEWKNILYAYSEEFKFYILETGKKAKLPFGFGDFSINKKKRKKTLGPNNEYINLPIDWKRTKEKGKVIYNMNYHTEGFFFGWLWFRDTTTINSADLWYFKPARNTSRLLAHYIHSDGKYMKLYKEWSSMTPKM